MPAERVDLATGDDTHPLSAIRITNDTGSSLPAGVLTLYDAAGAAFARLLDGDRAVEEGSDGGGVGAQVLGDRCDGVFAPRGGESEGEEDLVGEVIVQRPAEGRGHLDYGTFPDESFAGPILAFAPGLAGRYTF